MRPAALLAAGLLAGAAATSPASAHRLDETLLATLVAVEPGQVRATTRVVPGQWLAPAAIAQVDTDGDGAFSPAEQEAGVRRVLQGLAFRLDGRAVTPRLVSWRFPTPALVREGQGEIRLDYTLPAPTGAGEHVLELDSRPAAGTVHLVNALAPTSDGLEITGQKRNAGQTAYELDFRTGAAPAAAMADATPLPVDPRLQAFARGAPWAAGTLLALALALASAWRWRQRQARSTADSLR